MDIEEAVDKTVKDYEENPLFFYRSIIKIRSDLIEEYERQLLEKIPNLIITHSDRDTEENIRNQIVKINEMIDKGICPYFIDLTIHNKQKRYVR